MNASLGTANSAGRRRLGLTAAVLFAATLAAYLPALGAGFVWDDNAYVTKPDLRSLHGLWRIWFELGSTEQYYPLLHSAFWVQYHLWGEAPFWYHLLNVLLHATAALLFGLVLARLWSGDEASSLVSAEERGWKPRLHFSAPVLASFIFALHPMCVESVAWISEQKNTQSTVFYLLSMLVYLRYDEARERALLRGWSGSPRDACDADRDTARTSASEASRSTPWGEGHRPRLYYFAALLFFIFALLSKTVTATLPAAILVIFWWKRGRLGWKRDVRPLVPWLALGAVAGLFSGWVERKYVGAEGPAFALSLAQRFVLSGRTPWFYLSKLLWPARLIFTYPRWTVDAGAWMAWLFPLAALALALGLAAMARRTRAPLAAYLFFVGTLVPTIGIFNIYAFYFSYVADHWQYLACLGIIALAAGGMSALSKRRRRGFQPRSTFETRLQASSTLLVCVLGVLTWRQCGIYRDKQTLYTRTIEANPGAWMAYNNLGNLEYHEGRMEEAIARYREALRLNPDLPEAEDNLGLALIRTGHLPESLPHFRRAIQINPAEAEPYENLGVALNSSGRPTEAIADFEAALHLASSDDAVLRFNLGNAYSALGRYSEAIASYRQALQLKPEYAPARCFLAEALAQTGDIGDAITELRRAIADDPNYAPARHILSEIQGSSPQP